MRVRRQAVTTDFLTEIIQLFVCQTAFYIGTGIDAGSGVALYEYQISFFAFAFGTPEVVEADIIQSGSRLEGGDMTAQFQIFFARAQYHGSRIPADDGADAVFQLVIAGRFLLFAYRNRIQIGGSRVKRHVDAAAAGVFHQIFQQEMRALGAFVFQHGA